VKGSENLKLRRGFKSEAENISAQCRRDLGLKEFHPLSSFVLAKHLELEVITPSDLPGLRNESLNELLSGSGTSHWSAVTIGVEKPVLIIYNSSHSPARIESNIMHEAAHVLLKHPMGEIDTSLGIPLRKYDPIQEMEAEWLGGCLQLPTPALKKYYCFGTHTIEQIAEIFNASIQMVRYRLGVSGAATIKSRFRR
jgi:hypothetical protein